MLVLTDHTGHSAQNSLYPLVQAMRHHPRCDQIDVATRGNVLNDFFFIRLMIKAPFVIKADESFAYHPDGRSLNKNLQRVRIDNYDVVWLRMPPPLSTEFLGFLDHTFANQLIINDPLGIYETGSKQFLLNFPGLCPPMKACYSIEEILDFKDRFPIVLKPFRNYGGNGIVRIDGEKVWEGKRETTLEEFLDSIKNQEIAYLAVKFLKNVSLGDKRIVVVDGKIMGASLRLPAERSWICNGAMGGSSNYTEVDEDEVSIVNRLTPSLNKLGIVMYGIDTLVNDEGRRILSEINTTSIGGLPQIAKLTGKPVVEESADLIWNYIVKKIAREDVNA